jgi:hypothetical protein
VLSWVWVWRERFGGDSAVIGSTPAARRRSAHRAVRALDSRRLPPTVPSPTARDQVFPPLWPSAVRATPTDSATYDQARFTPGSADEEMKEVEQAARHATRIHRRLICQSTIRERMADYVTGDLQFVGVCGLEACAWLIAAPTRHISSRPDHTLPELQAIRRRASPGRILRQLATEGAAFAAAAVLLSLVIVLADFLRTLLLSHPVERNRVDLWVVVLGPEPVSEPVPLRANIAVRQYAETVLRALGARARPRRRAPPVGWAPPLASPWSSLGFC